MAESTYNVAVSELANGINIDVDPTVQPKGSRRYSLNTVEKSGNGHFNLANEPSNAKKGQFPIGFIPLGDRYMTNSETVTILVDPENDRQEIGVIGVTGLYVSYVNTAALSLNVRHQCDIKFRVRRGNERVIYWTDGLNNARSLNLDRLYDYYTVQYQDYLRVGGNPATYIGEKWDAASFELVRTYKKVPSFDGVEILEFGSTQPGSYNFSIQLVDEDLNPTEWITTSNTVNIFNDSLDNPYERIRGSRNVDTSSQSFPRASKTIRLTIGNLDDSFPFYRVAIIRASGGTGTPDKVLVSDLQSTGNSIFTYSGNDASLSEIALEEVLLGKQVLYAPQHIEQQENILLLAHTKGKGINWCEFQQYASKISASLTTKQVILNSVFSDPNVKNANSTFKYRGNMPGEVYSYGIGYVFDDGYVTPGFHIPGKNPLDTSSSMMVHELDSSYLDIHNCSVGNYWGVDSMGQPLVGRKVRHHRFPFRKDVGKPLVTRTTTTTNINKYKLTIEFDFNPVHTPIPPTYPLDTDGDPIPINFVMNYQVTGSPTTSSFSGTLTESDVTTGTIIIIHDDTVPLDDIATGTKYEIDPTCELATYMDLANAGANAWFLITETYAPYVATTVQAADVAEIFGISFSNITRPHPNVVGFYIVRQGRTDEDRIIVDSGIFGNITEANGFKSFGLLAPKQYYPSSNCGGHTDNSGKTVVFSTDSMWFFNPEYQYFQKKANFDDVVVEGRYVESSYQMPTISNVTGSTCNEGGMKGVYIDDVQAGTSYDPERNKDKNADDDGFDLIIGYRNTNFNFQLNVNQTNPYVIPSSERNMYLTAASYQNYNGSTYYNVSVDNKIGMYIPDSPIAANLLRDNTNNTNALVYGALVRDNTTSYSNFINRPYYKEHNNMIPFGNNNVINNFEVFNGDVQISSSTIVSSVYYDMVVGDFPKKSSLWKIIAGSVLLVAGVALSVTGVLTAPGIGLTIAAATALTSAAISYGVSLIVSGIKFEQFQSMVQTDYEKGLKDTVVDGGVYETIRDNIGRDTDDTIRWFGDRISNIYMESAVAMGLRTGLTAGVTDFIDSPATYDEALFRTYLTEKLTSIDREQGSGRLYRGFASAEIYDMNLDYLRHNREKIFIHLPVEYDCCSDSNEIYPRRVHWSEQSFQEEKVDNFRSFLPNNYCDVEGEHGEITGMYRMGNNLFLQTTEGTWQLPQNQQERVTNEVVSFIGTGNLFSILPRKVVDDDRGSLGTKHKWANCKTMVGMFSISETENKIFLHSDKIKEISAEGLKSFSDESIRPFLSEQMLIVFGVEFTNINNPVNPYGTGYHSTYDSKFNRVIFTKRDYLLLPEKISSLEIVNMKPISGAIDFVYNTEDGIFYQGTTPVPLSNKLYFEDKSFTVSFSLNTFQWVSWHSYIPNFYIHSKGRMFSWEVGEPNNYYWIHGVEGHYQTFYGRRYPHIIEGVLPVGRENIFDDITIQTKALSYDPVRKQYLEMRHVTFNKINIYNNLQNSGELVMQVKQETPGRQNWFSQQIKRTLGQIIISKENGSWNINSFRDYIVDHDTPMFTSEWEEIQSQYPIDKVVTPLVTNFNKDWRFLESFRGKYIVFRLKFDTFDNVNLITNYLLSTTNLSV